MAPRIVDTSNSLRGKYTALDQPPSPEPEAGPRSSRSSSSASTFSDLSDFDPLNYDAGTLKRKSTTRPRSRKSSSKHSPGSASFRPNRPSLRHRLCTKFACFLILLFFSTVILLLSAVGLWALRQSPREGESEGWYPSPAGGTAGPWSDAYAKAAKLVGQMTLVEKVNITTGIGWSMGMCVGNTGPVPRLGFPSLCLQDGPLGIRFADHATAFPAGITVGSTWDKDLFYRRGKAHGQEAKGKGVNVLLGPAMGPLGRLPAGGRNWEGFGSDPVLQGIAAAQTIRGIQSEGVMATAKHFVGNEQEHFRQSWEWGTPNAISSNIDDRTLHEVYGWPFADSVKAGVASVMCSYNQVNNSYACQNSKLLNGVLKDELGFQGFVQSDWLAQRSGVASALAGLDMSMPGDGLRWQDGTALWGPELTKAVLNESVPIQRLDDMATRIVAAWYQLGQDGKDWADGPNFSSWTNEKEGLLHPGSDSKEKGVVNKFKDVQGDHGKLVRQIAAEGTVLLKNDDNFLPLSKSGWRDPDAHDMVYRVGVFGEDARVNPDGINSCPDRGCNKGTLASGWGSGSAEFPYLVEPLAAIRKAFDNTTVYVTDWPNNELPSEEDEILGDQDLCIVFANADGGEGYLKADDVSGDRNDLYLQKGSDALIKHVADNCGGGSGVTIAVIHTIGPVIMENWIEHPSLKAVLYAHLPSQESGNSLVDVLFGDINPSGHLPYTIARDEDDYGPTSHILRKPNFLVPQQNFSEGLFIDYRYLDSANITPRFPFGFGLSYTNFSLASLKVTKNYTSVPSRLPETAPPSQATPPSYPTTLPDPSEATVPTGWRKLKNYIYPYLPAASDVKKGPYPYPPTYSTKPHAPQPASANGHQGGNPDLYTTLAMVEVDVENVGNVAGKAVPQLYVSFPGTYTDPETGETVDFPKWVLRGFEKVTLEPGERTTVTMGLTRRDLSYWSTRRQQWVLPSVDGEEGTWKVRVAWDVRDEGVAGWL